MPLYDFECPKCKRTIEKFCCINVLEEVSSKQKCPECKIQMKRLIGGAHKDWFQPHINEDFNGTPIEVTSRKHLKELCKQFGVTSRAL